jgi:hypothetical protein
VLAGLAGSRKKFGNVKSDSKGKPLFSETEQTHLYIECLPLNFGGADRATHFLTVRAFYHVGFLATEEGTLIQAQRMGSAPAILQLVDRLSGWGMEALPLEAAMPLLKLGAGDIIPGANCHGYTFARSSYWIDNEWVNLLLKGDGYREVDLATATAAVFWEDQKVVHSCRVVSADGQTRYIGKAGIGAVQEAHDLKSAARGNRFTEVRYYRREES